MLESFSPSAIRVLLLVGALARGSGGCSSASPAQLAPVSRAACPLNACAGDAICVATVGVQVTAGCFSDTNGTCSTSGYVDVGGMCCPTPGATYVCAPPPDACKGVLSCGCVASLCSDPPWDAGVAASCQSTSSDAGSVTCTIVTP